MSDRETITSFNAAFLITSGVEEKLASRLAQQWEAKCEEVSRLQRDCAELYQVIGTLSAAHGDLFVHPQVVKALDNARAAADGGPRPWDDLLPFTPLGGDALQAAIKFYRGMSDEPVYSGRQVANILEHHEPTSAPTVDAKTALENGDSR